MDSRCCICQHDCLNLASSPNNSIASLSVLVPALFLAGALAGYAFGERGGPRRVKLLGSAAGLLVAVLGWALLVITR